MLEYSDRFYSPLKVTNRLPEYEHLGSSSRLPLDSLETTGSHIYVQYEVTVIASYTAFNQMLPGSQFITTNHSRLKILPKYTLQIPRTTATQPQPPSR